MKTVRKHLLCSTAVLVLGGFAFASPASAAFHGAGIQKSCQPTKIGDKQNCDIRITSLDTLSDTVRVTEAWDVADFGGSNARQPAAGNLPIIGMSAGTTCAAGPSFPCDLANEGDWVDVRSNSYTIQAGDPDPLPDQANAHYTDLCDGTPSTDCTTTVVNDLQVAGVSNLFQPAISLSKTGPAASKAGDTASYSITLTDTSSADTPARTCTVTDSLKGSLGSISAGVPLNYTYVIPAGTPPGALSNTATASCGIAGFANVLSASDGHDVQVFAPSITVDKSGPAKSKPGDTITYSVLVTNTSSAGTPALSCTANDSLAGSLGAVVPGTPKTYTYAIPAGASGTLTNTVNVSCSIAGFPNAVVGSDSHDVQLFTPSISVDKSGPSASKAGDTITYSVLVTNTSSAGTPALSCTANDTLAGSLGAVIPGTPKTYTYAIPAGQTSTLSNTVNVTCSIAGFPNTVSGSDSHDVTMILPGVTLDKVCRPSSVLVGQTLYWDITAHNSGNVPLNCLLNDPTAGVVDHAATLAPGANDSITVSRATTVGDVGTVSNTATVNCSLTGLPNTVSATASDDCEVTQQNEICRTPGFWGTHAGTEKANSSNLTQTAIAAAGGSLSICGRTITNTNLGSQASALEAICVSVQGAQQRQLARQLTAMALNCVISGGGANCDGTSVEGLFADANAACLANSDDSAITGFISQVDDYNNGLTNGCHDVALTESDVFSGISPLPGPAGSSTACSAATKNQVYVVPVP